MVRGRKLNGELLTSIWLSLFDMLDQLVSVVDEDFNIVKMNKRMEEVFGDVIGEKCYKIFHSTDSPPPYCQINAFREGGRDVGEFFEKSLSKWIRVKVREVELDGKTLFLHIVEDITKTKALENELLKQKIISESIVENARFIIIAFEKNGKITLFNRMAEEISGISGENEITLEDLLDLIPEREEMLRFIGKLERSHFAETVTTFAGRRIRWQGSKIALNSEEMIVLMGDDITESERIERELKESEEKYRTLIEKSHDAIYIFKNNRLVFVNDMAPKMTGYTKEELYLMEDPFIIIHPEDRDKLIESGSRRIKGEEAQESFDARIITKDGEIRYVNFSVSLIRYQGEPAILGTVRDYTDKKLMEEELRRSEEKYRTLVETMDDVVFTLDLEGRFTFLNKKFEEKTGYRAEEMIGRRFIEILSPEYIESTLEVFEKGIKGEKTPLLTLETVKKDGTKIPVEINVTNLYDGGNVVGRIGVARDISERVKMERDVRERTELLKLINKILRHDITNDLSVIAGARDLLGSETTEEGKREFLDVIGSAVERSTDLIKKMRELENLTMGNGLKPMKVHEIAKEILDGFKLEYKVEGNVKGKCVAMADDALKSVLSNLIRNAIVHGKTQRVDIKIKKENNFCVIEVADFGVGIPTEVRDKIFEEGFTYGESGKTGLGLYIVKKIVERYGGDVSVKENSPRGTVFVLRIPAAHGGV